MTKFETVILILTGLIVLPLLGAIGALSLQLEDEIENLPTPSVQVPMPDQEPETQVDSRGGIPA